MCIYIYIYIYIYIMKKGKRPKDQKKPQKTPNEAWRES